MANPGKNRFFIISIVFIHVCFFVWQILHGNYLLTDSLEYLKAAANLKSDFILYCGDLDKPVITEFFSRRPPVYPLFLVACQLISPGMIVVIVIQNILSITGIHIVRKIILNFGYKEKYDPLLIVLLLFTPAQFIYANMIMSDTLFQFFIILIVWFFIKFMNERRYIYGFFYSIILSLSVLTKPVFVFFIFANVLFFIWISFKRASLKPLLLSLIPLLLLFTYQYRNYRQTGVFEVSSLVSTNLVHYNAYFVLVYSEGLQKADSTIAYIDNFSKHRKTYKDDVVSQKQQFIEIVKKYPVSYAIFHAKGMAAFFLDPGRFDLVSFFNPNAAKGNGLLYYINQDGLKGTLAFLFSESFVLLIFLVLIFMLNIFKLLCFIRYIFQRSYVNTYGKWFVVFLISYIAFVTGSIGLSRYMMPVVPLYIGCGLLFLSQTNDDNSEIKWKYVLKKLFLKSPTKTISAIRN